MKPTVKIAAFIGILAVAFLLAFGVGRITAPSSSEAGQHNPMPEHTAQESGMAMSPNQAGNIPGGLMVSEQGYTLKLSSSNFAPGAAVPFSFSIEGPDGQPVTHYELEHEKQLHLIAVRRDFSGYQHLHPTLGPNGLWSTVIGLNPGSWRVYADFKASGAEPLTLAADLAVPGAYPAAPRTTAARTVVVDGYTLTLAGNVTAGQDSELQFTVTKNGQPVTDLEPYLGAYGHLVALREGDLAYLHVHPSGAPGDGKTPAGPTIAFMASVPSAGSYQFYLDFKHGGKVRTAHFSVAAGESAGSASPPASSTTPSANPHSGH